MNTTSGDVDDGIALIETVRCCALPIRVEAESCSRVIHMRRLETSSIAQRDS
jgi:hypothetical protein